MKRKLYTEDSSTEEPASKQIKSSDQGHTFNICELPSEIHSEILNYLENATDGGNFLLTRRELYHQLYSSHDLFLSCRMIRDLGRLVNKVSLPTFKRSGPIVKPNEKLNKKSVSKDAEKDDDSDEDNDESDEDYEDSDEEEEKLNRFESKLLKTAEELAQVVKGVESKVQSKEKMVEKMREWNSFLDKVEKTHGKEIAKQLEEKIFSKCTILSFETERMDYRYTYTAEIQIGDVIIEHNAYDEEGCATNWSLTMRKKKEKSFLFAELPYEKDTLIVSKLKQVQSYLELDLPAKVLMDSIVMALPWKSGWNCVFYFNVKEK